MSSLMNVKSGNSMMILLIFSIFSKITGNNIKDCLKKLFKKVFKKKGRIK
jgi:GTPase SAR1 family protein